MPEKYTAAAERFTHTAILALVAPAIATLFAGCATPIKDTAYQPLVWPPPPLTARVEFVRNIVSDADLGVDTTFTERLLSFLSGAKPKPNRIVEPMGLVVSDDGKRLYASDFAHLAVFIFDFEKNAFTRIGTEERLARPVGLALDGEENLYVVEQEKKGISVFNRQGQKIRFITSPDIERPTGIAIDRQRGRIYLADTAHTKSTTHEVVMFNLRGQRMGTVGAGKGSGPGQFLFPTYLAVDKSGNLYVTDTLNSRVQMFDPQAKYVKTFGSRGSAWGMFDKPKGVALDNFGNVYVADSGWSNVQIFNQKGQVLLFFGGRGPIPGMMKNPTAVAIDGNNHIFVADYLNHRIGVYRLVNTSAADSFLNPPAAGTGKNTINAGPTTAAAINGNEALSSQRRQP
jgi:DNA-binding beta-propeller fold protein YncE